VTEDHLACKNPVPLICIGSPKQAQEEEPRGNQKSERRPRFIWKKWPLDEVVLVVKINRFENIYLK